MKTKRNVTVPDKKNSANILQNVAEFLVWVKHDHSVCLVTTFLFLLKKLHNILMRSCQIENNYIVRIFSIPVVFVKKN